MSPDIRLRLFLLSTTDLQLPLEIRECFVRKMMCIEIKHVLFIPTTILRTPTKVTFPIIELNFIHSFCYSCLEYIWSLLMKQRNIFR